MMIIFAVSTTKPFSGLAAPFRCAFFAFLFHNLTGARSTRLILDFAVNGFR